MNALNNMRIDDFATMKYGKMPPKSIMSDEGYPIYSGYRITGYAKEYLYKEPELIVVARGVGGTGDVKISPPESWITNLSIVLSLSENIVDKKFLYYRLGREPLKERLNTGAAQAQITIENLRSYEIAIPPLSSQKRIASILSAYDDLIETNRRRIVLLEEAARLLYREWFVYFRFPGHEHTRITDGLPVGWSLETVSNLASYISRGISPQYDEEAEGLVVNQKCIRDGKLNLGLARRQSKKVPAPKFLQSGDVLVNSTGAGTLGRVCQCHIEREGLTVDSHVTIVRPGPKVPPLWFGMSLILKEAYIETLGRGATNQTELSKDDLGKLNLPLAPDSILQEFEVIITPLVNQIRTLSGQNEQLASARDLLLPRLMDGKIEV